MNRYGVSGTYYISEEGKVHLYSPNAYQLEIPEEIITLDSDKFVFLTIKIKYKSQNTLKYRHRKSKVRVGVDFLESADIYRYQQSKYTDIFKDGKLMLSVIETPVQIRYLVSVQEGRSDFDVDVFSTLGKRGLNPALVVARAKGVRLRLSS